MLKEILSLDSAKACEDTEIPTKLIKNSILPNMSKIIECFIFKQISNFMEPFFSKQQCGFRKGYNTQYCLLS